jgi:hypothetical protein
MAQPKEEINPKCFDCHLADCNPDNPNCPIAKTTVKLRMDNDNIKVLKQYLLKVSGQQLEEGIVELLDVVAERIRAKRQLNS